jgi:hypothetical protein
LNIMNNQKEANKRWRIKNAEFLKKYHREKYLKNREVILERYRQKNKLKARKNVEAHEVIEVPKRYRLFEVIDVLHKDFKHRLWGKCVKEWSDKDWLQFNILKNKVHGL